MLCFKLSSIAVQIPWCCLCWREVGGIRKVRVSIIRGTKPRAKSQQGPCSCLVGKKPVWIAQSSDSLQVLLLYTSSTFIILKTILSTYYFWKCWYVALLGKARRRIANQFCLYLSFRLDMTGINFCCMNPCFSRFPLSPVHLAIVPSEGVGAGGSCGGSPCLSR